MAQITELLERMHAGDAAARDTLFAAAYNELRRLARARLRDGGRNTVLETTSLVRECYLRFVGAGDLRAEDRRAFLVRGGRPTRWRSMICLSFAVGVEEDRVQIGPPIHQSDLGNS